MIYLLFSLLIAATQAAYWDVAVVNGQSALPLTPVLKQTKENNSAACRLQCVANDDCVEATFVNGECKLFHNVVLTRGGINGAVYYKRDRGDPMVDCVGQELYDDMCRSEDANVEKCSDWIGDGTCDNGFTLSDTFHQIFLNCQKFSFDGGDCDKPGAADAAACFSDMTDDYKDSDCKVPQDGVVEDCWGQVLKDEDCVVAKLGITKCSEWLGNDSCDAGQTMSDKGVMISFFCERHEWDQGDCEPAVEDTPSPTKAPTEPPTDSPTTSPTPPPTNPPTKDPTESPTDTPTLAPTQSPTDSPTDSPTAVPTVSPTDSPTNAPTRTPPPIEIPTEGPTESPTVGDTPAPTESVTDSPTESPTVGDTPAPTESVTDSPTESPTDSPTLAPTNTPTAEPTGKGVYDDEVCVGVSSNKADNGGFSEAQIDASLALDGDFFKISRGWDASSMLLCNSDKDIYQNKVHGQGDPKVHAILCYGNKEILDENKLYAIYNLGQGAEIYGEFEGNKGCDVITWDQVDNDECQSICNDSLCKKDAKALAITPCGDAPTDAPTQPPTETDTCKQYTDKTTCKNTPSCTWDSGVCSTPPPVNCPDYDDTNSKTCEEFTQCKWDKDTKKCGDAPPPDPCASYSKKTCKAMDECTWENSKCKTAEVVEPTPTPTGSPTAAGETSSPTAEPEPTPGPTTTPTTCETYAAYQQRMIDANIDSEKNCAKFAGQWDKKKETCSPYEYKNGVTKKLKCKKFNEVTCTCLNNKCKAKMGKKKVDGKKVKVFKKCKGKHQFKQSKHGDPLPEN